MIINWIMAIAWVGLLIGYLGFFYDIEKLKQQIARLQHGYYENSDAIDDLYERIVCDEDICDDCVLELESFTQSELPPLPVTPKKKSVKKVAKKSLTKKSK